VLEVVLALLLYLMLVLEKHLDLRLVLELRLMLGIKISDSISMLSIYITNLFENNISRANRMFLK